MSQSRRKDSAWSWVVVMAALLSQTLLGGICLSGGMFFVIFQSALNSSTIATSWLCSLPITTWFCATAIGSIITNKFGYRTSSFIGGIIASMGLSLCYFTTSIGFLFITYGTLTGVGLGINYTGCMTAVNVYCDKYKTIGSGIVSIGHNLSLIVYAKFVVYLDDEYGWRGAMLIHGAIMFNLCLFASLMSPLDVDKPADSEIDAQPETRYVLTNDKSGFHVNGSINGCSNSSLSSKPKTLQGSRIDIVRNVEMGSGRGFSKTYLDQEQKTPLTQDNGNLSDKSKSRDTENKRTSKLVLFRKSDFICFCASNILCNLSQGIYILHLPPYATINGFSRDDFGLVLTVYGATNIVGKVIYSFLGQHPKIEVTMLYTVSLTATGVCMCLTPVFLSKAGMLTLAGFVGFFYCVTGALLVAVVFRIVGYEQFANGLGLSMPFKATGNLIGGPLGGTLFSVTGDYRTSFYVAGVSMILASALMVQPVIKHKRGSSRPDPADIRRHRNKFSVCETEIANVNES